jgi:hypothetical protein
MFGFSAFAKATADKAENVALPYIILMFRALSHSRIHAFAHSRIHAFAHSRIHAFTHSRILFTYFLSADQTSK